MTKQHFATSLDCQRLWNDYLGNVPRDIDWSRFARLDPELDGGVPALDEVDKMQVLQKTVRDKMSNDPRVQQLATQLIASSFYFELSGSITEHSSTLFSAHGECCVCLSVPG